MMMRTVVVLALLGGATSAAPCPRSKLLPGQLPWVECPTVTVRPCTGCTRLDLGYATDPGVLGDRWHEALTAGGWTATLAARAFSEPPGPGDVVATVTATKGRGRVAIDLVVGGSRGSSVARLQFTPG